MYNIKHICKKEKREQIFYHHYSSIQQQEKRSKKKEMPIHAHVIMLRKIPLRCIF